MITSIVDFVVGGLFSIIALFVGLLPDFNILDFLDIDNPLLREGLGWLNWFVPVGDLVAIGSVWVAAIFVYQAYLVFGEFFFKFIK